MQKPEDQLIYQQKVYSVGNENRYSLLYVSILIVSLSTFIIGYDTVLVSSALVFVKEYFHLISQDVERLVSSILLSAIFGAILGWPCCLLIGRKKTQLLSGFIG